MLVADRLSSRSLLALAAVVIGVQVLLVWWTPFVPLVDLPMHLANAKILEWYDRFEPFRSLYVVHREPIPNLGFYFLLAPLLDLAEPQTASKILLSGIIVLFGIGSISLSKAIHGRYTLGGVLACFLIIGTSFQWGFLNYILGLGLFLISFGIWLRWRSRLTTMRFVGLSLLATACYLAHLSAIAFFAGAVLIWSFYQYRSGERAGRLALQMLPLYIVPVPMFLMFMGSHGSAGTVWGFPLAQKMAWFVDLFSAYGRWSVALVLPFMAAAIIVAWRDRSVLSVCRPALACAVLFIAGYLICPPVLLTSWAADLRFVIPAAVFLLVAFKSLRTTKRIKIAFVLVSIGMLARLAIIGNEWRGFSGHYASALAVMQRVPIGSRVFVVQPQTDSLKWPVVARLNTLPSYLVLYRNAVVSSHQAFATQHPVTYRVPLYSGLVGFDRAQRHIDWDSVETNYDYVWTSELDRPTALLLDSTMDLMDRDSWIALYRIRRPSNKQ